MVTPNFFLHGNHPYQTFAVSSYAVFCWKTLCCLHSGTSPTRLWIQVG